MIDIRTIRIGSHVSVDGKRARVIGIERSGLIELEATDGDLLRVLINDVEPISLTPELLTEIGFEEDKTDIVKRVSGYFIYFHQINNLRWRVSLEEENCTVYGNTLCRHLHEAEAFLALHGVELIPD